MKIYFGRVFETDTDTKDLFEHNGKFFYYELDFNEDFGEFSIKDTAGRYVPFEASDANSLINIVSYVRDHARASKGMHHYFNSALDNLARLYSLE